MTIVADPEMLAPYGLRADRRHEAPGVDARPPRSLDEGQLTVSVSVAPGSTAVLEIPTPEPGGLHEGDRPAAEQVGVLAVQPSAGGATVRVTSGRYTFSAVNAGANRAQSG